MTIRVLVLCVVLVCGVLAGCGDDDESGGGGGSSSGGGEALSLNELAAEADKICKTGADAARKVQPPSDISDAAAAEEYLGQIVPITRKQADDIDALEPAGDVGPEWQEFVDKQNELAAFLEDVLQKAKDKDPSGIQDLAKVPQLGEEFTKVANEVGAEGCASGA